MKLLVVYELIIRYYVLLWKCDEIHERDVRKIGRFIRYLF